MWGFTSSFSVVGLQDAQDKISKGRVLGTEGNVWGQTGEMILQTLTSLRLPISLAALLLHAHQHDLNHLTGRYWEFVRRAIGSIACLQLSEGFSASPG